MKISYYILVLLLGINSNLIAQYHSHFNNKALRIDFTLAGDARTEFAFLYRLKQEKKWGGSKTNLIDNYHLGQNRMIILHNNDTLYTQGFATLFEEWQKTPEAAHTPKSFAHSVQCPFPKHPVKVIIESRNDDQSFHPILNINVDPNSNEIIKSSSAKANTSQLIHNGETEHCIDLVFIAEGYDKNQMEKFHADALRMSNYLFQEKPFDKHKDKFNIWIIDAVSEDSGITDPTINSWLNTALNSSFNTFGSERYLQSQDTYIIRDYAGLVPYDQIYVLANTEKYGGGGIFNHYSITSVDHKQSLPVFTHEFGHCFTGLADEYYTSEIAYCNYFNLNHEPWQPNITTMVNFSAKWEDMLLKDTPIPTPAINKNKHLIGVFEGGGYLEKGIFRPYIDCRMKSTSAEHFCPVCQKTIENMILFLTK